MKKLIGIITLMLLILVSGCTQTNQGPSGTGSEGDETEITSDELAQHNSEDSCWIAYEGKVYDVTNWLRIHPGGKDKILEHCGTSDQFETAFTDQHGTSKVSKLMQEGVIMGVLE